MSVHDRDASAPPSSRALPLVLWGVGSAMTLDVPGGCRARAVCGRTRSFDFPHSVQPAAPESVGSGTCSPGKFVFLSDSFSCSPLPDEIFALSFYIHKRPGQGSLRRPTCFRRVPSELLCVSSQLLTRTRTHSPRAGPSPPLYLARRAAAITQPHRRRPQCPWSFFSACPCSCAPFSA